MAEEPSPLDKVTKAALIRIKDSLNKTKLRWLHAYYMPGDNFYVYIRTRHLPEELSRKLRGVGGFSRVDPVGAKDNPYKWDCPTVASYFRKYGKKTTLSSAK